jgi:hypothetical protein
VPPTDSGYASVIKTLDNKYQNHVDPNSICDGQDMTALQLDDAATEYTEASSIATLKRESYIADFADDLLHQISDLQPDEQRLERISNTVLPDLLKAFALRLGYNAPTPMHCDVIYFVHKYRK